MHYGGSWVVKCWWPKKPKCEDLIILRKVGIDIKKLNDGGFQFYQSVLVWNVLKSNVTDNCNGFPTPTKVDAPVWTFENGPEDKI